MMSDGGAAPAWRAPLTNGKVYRRSYRRGYVCSMHIVLQSYPFLISIS